MTFDMARLKATIEHSQIVGLGIADDLTEIVIVFSDGSSLRVSPDNAYTLHLNHAHPMNSNGSRVM